MAFRSKSFPRQRFSDVAVTVICAVHRGVYLTCGWLPPKWDWVDPLKDARAEIEQIEAGLKSRTKALAERGYDAEQVDTEIAADKVREKSLGLIFGTAPPTTDST